jgi:hypothetical protein
MSAELPLTSTERSARRRAELRMRGLRPRTFWLPDTSSAAFMERARRDCDYLWGSVDRDADAIAFAEAMTDEILIDLDRAESRR